MTMDTVWKILLWILIIVVIYFIAREAMKGSKVKSGGKEKKQKKK